MIIWLKNQIKVRYRIFQLRLIAAALDAEAAREKYYAANATALQASTRAAKERDELAKKQRDEDAAKVTALQAATRAAKERDELAKKERDELAKKERDELAKKAAAAAEAEAALKLQSTTHGIKEREELAKKIGKA